MPVSLYVVRIDGREPVKRGVRVIGEVEAKTYIVCFYDGSSHSVFRLRFEDGIYRGGDVEKLRGALQKCLERGDTLVYHSPRQLSLLVEALKKLPKTFTILEQVRGKGLLVDLGSTRPEATGTAIMAPEVLTAKGRTDIGALERTAEGSCVGASKAIYEALLAPKTGEG